MLLPLTAEWRAARERKRKAIAFLAAVRREPAEADVRWLAGAAARDDQDHARWELRYARLALAVLTAQRDALDDRTGSDVVAALGEAMAEDPRVDPMMQELVGRQLNDRLSGYKEALIARGGAVGSGERLGRVLLAFASAGTSRRRIRRCAQSTAKPHFPSICRRPKQRRANNLAGVNGHWSLVVGN